MNIVRIYNQNRKQIWWAILVIASLFIVLQFVNNRTKEKNKEIVNQSKNILSENVVSSNTKNEIGENLTNKTTTNISGTSGVTIDEEKLKNAEDLLDKFFGYCNNKQLNQAYEMLTDECKQLIYPNLEIFEKNYYNNIFQNNKKIYYFENWSNNTYMVTIDNDALAMGKITDASDKKVDYITIENEKLNISSYIGRKNINKENISQDIKVLVNYKDIYMDYEVYNITVTNGTQNTICLANIDSSKEIYLEDDNEAKYEVYNHELLQDNLILRSNHVKNIDLKFYSSYISSKQINWMVFKNVFLDYDNDLNKTYDLGINLKH